jgi:hypothetical protein
MAIVLFRGGEKYYASGTGRVTGDDRVKADQLDKELRFKLKAFEKNMVKNGLVLSDGTKKDALRVWYEVGKLLNEIGTSYGILGTSDEPYYWQTIYNYVSPLVQRAEPPKSSTSPLRNHFRLCAYMAKRGDWEFVKNVGNWSVWRDLLDNIRLQEDPRVFDWVVNAMHKSGLGHKEARPFIHEVRRSIKNKDTKVLTDRELITKLQPLLGLIPTDK